MCGIVGAVAKNNIVPVLLEGIARLEYRGYDSTGLAVVHSTETIERLVSTARVADLAAQADAKKMQATTGISHTRWATHGRPTETNAHPHTSRNEIALVHNGIIENYETLREMLKAEGYEFITQTDTEVIAHLVHKHWHADEKNGARGDLRRAVQAAAQQLTGAYAIAVVSAREPDRLVGARFGSPLVVGRNDDGAYLASDAVALFPITQHIAFLEEGDVVDLTRDAITCYDRDGKPIERAFMQIEASTAQAELGPYQHFMQKEIFEQPRAIADSLEGVETVTPALFGEQAENVFSKIDSVLILACGTSYHAGQVTKHWIESLVRLPCQVEIANEYRYRDSVPNPNALVVVISQSGETADTLSALNHAKALGHTHTLSICNVATSTMMRQTELRFLTRAGAEIGVASTKAFTAQLMALFLLTLTLAKERGRLTAEEEAFWLRSLRHLPSAMQATLGLEPQIVAWAEALKHKTSALFLGRGLHFPIAQEGALKLKETSYIHAEAFPTGELKHGPLALVDADMPAITIAPNNALFEKTKSNLQEVRARGAELFVVTDLDSHFVADDGVHVLRVPEHESLLSPIIHVAPLQLLAYHTAVLRGTDVDKPRNLAKSVTVE
ncbi:MAG: glutamine--fructose-6-phosphate transaminase (isomerizing) [Proteobacteria bacterium]|nr:glutamine--fructose-6-phosphate transaminase (isomerizing) [Pseudomonadota bacterium]MCL2308328.1 glutamine--fructose-6-phosphate transaminase (isomerizing) [Pseudomonadota bacterium]